MTNAERTGPATTLTYELQISRDANFAAKVLTTSAPEGAERTSFLLPTDLAGGIKYFWRVRATDTSKGDVGDYSLSQEFTVWGLHAGPYQLAVDFPAPWSRHNTLDGDLAETHESFTLAVRDSNYYSRPGELSLHLTVSAGGIVEGHIVSNYTSFSPHSGTYSNRLSISSTPGYYTSFDGPRATPVQLSGSLSSDGNGLGGTFDAYIGIDNWPYGWGGDRAFSDAPTHRFSWSLVPR